jgi:hypothetical protein
MDLSFPDQFNVQAGTRLSSRDDRSLRDLGADHLRRRPRRRGLSTQPEPDSTTPGHTVRHPHTQQRDNAGAGVG